MEQSNLKLKKKKKKSMEPEFMELEFHKKRHYRLPWNAVISKTLEKIKNKNLHGTQIHGAQVP